MADISTLWSRTLQCSQVSMTDIMQHSQYSLCVLPTVTSSSILWAKDFTLPTMTTGTAGFVSPQLSPPFSSGFYAEDNMPEEGIDGGLVCWEPREADRMTEISVQILCSCGHRTNCLMLEFLYESYLWREEREETCIVLCINNLHMFMFDILNIY